jgi:UPF0755 protein
VLARQLQAAGKLQVGEYPLDPKTTPRELLIAMRDGKVTQRRFTIVEGWNIRELRAALSRAEPLRHETTQLDDAALMKLLGHPGQHPEGRFLPENLSLHHRRQRPRGTAPCPRCDGQGLGVRVGTGGGEDTC